MAMASLYSPDWNVLGTDDRGHVGCERMDESRSNSRLSRESAVPSLRPSAAPTPIQSFIHRKRAPRVGEIGWAFSNTEGVFMASMDPAKTQEISHRANLHLHHIPAELKREYKLEGFYGIQNLPTPRSESILSQPAAISYARESLVSMRPVNRMPGLSPAARSLLGSPHSLSVIASARSSAAISKEPPGRSSVLSHSSHGSGASSARR